MATTTLLPFPVLVVGDVELLNDLLKEDLETLLRVLGSNMGIIGEIFISCSVGLGVGLTPNCTKGICVPMAKGKEEVRAVYAMHHQLELVTPVCAKWARTWRLEPR